jgi:hypothetical protein
MSTVDNLKFLGQVASEGAVLVAGVVANGSNYLADLVYLPKLVSFGEDAATAVRNLKTDLAEVKTLDDAGRQELAAAWQADMNIPALASVDAVLDTGVVIITWLLEAVGSFLAKQAPAA